MNSKTASGKIFLTLFSILALVATFALARPQNQNDKDRRGENEKKGESRGGGGNNSNRGGGGQPRQNESAPRSAEQPSRPAPPPPRPATPAPSAQPRSEAGNPAGRGPNNGNNATPNGPGRGPGNNAESGRGSANANAGANVNGAAGGRGSSNVNGGTNENGRLGNNANTGRGANNAGGGTGAGTGASGSGRVSTNAGGSANGRGGPNANGRPSGFGPTRTVTARGGVTGRVDSRGRITTIRGNGMVINHGANGERTIVTRRTDNTRIVSFGPRRGFVDRPFTRNGRSFVTRTYVVNGRSFAHVYVGVSFRGGVYYRYVPPVIFAPGFYFWAGRPWGAPVRFAWGWGPWFGFYGYYFTPYPVYADASLWLTDYLIAQNLQAAYEAQQAAAGPGYPPPPPPDPGYAATPLSPELKQAIDDEVRAELARESSATSNPQSLVPSSAPGTDQTPDALSPNIRTFIVSTPLNEQLADGTECPLSAGDVLTRITDTPDANGNVNVLVSGSQRNDCASGTQFGISVQDLQDMHNAFREQLDSGLNQLSQSQGKNGLPMGPAGNPTPLPDGTAQPDPSAQADLQQQQQAAQQTEQDVQGAASAR